MNIGIDIDGVLTNVEAWQNESAAKYMYEKYNKSIINAEGYDTSEIYGVTKEQDKKWWFESYEEYMKEPARKYASEVTNKLSEEGNNLYIITARCIEKDFTTMTNESMQAGIKEWLKSNNIKYDEIYFSPEDKTTICKKLKLDMMIEDKKTNIEEISKIMPVYCFDAKYNRDIAENEKIIRCYNWYDIYKKIKERG